MDTCLLIDQIYETMSISNAILCCNNTEEISYIIDTLESKSYPLYFLSSFNEKDYDRYPNKLFLTSSLEFNSKHFQDFFQSKKLECIIFVGIDSFSNCIPILRKKEITSEFIFII